MSKWVWCGVAGLIVIAGALVGTRYFNSSPASIEIATTSPPPPTDEPTGDLIKRAPTWIPKSPNIPLTLELQKLQEAKRLQEPIETQLEDLELSSAPAISTLETAGLKESDASNSSAPHPDPETRQMPYADNATPRPKESFLSWIGLAEWVNEATSRVNTVEESAEPPMLAPPVPAYHHPPHCPYHGHCPYPYSTNRYVR